MPLVHTLLPFELLLLLCLPKHPSVSNFAGAAQKKLIMSTSVYDLFFTLVIYDNHEQYVVHFPLNSPQMSHACICLACSSLHVPWP